MKRFWRIIKFGALGCAGLLGVGLIWMAVANAQASGKLQEKLDALKAAGEPTTLADLARKPIPPETNAATYLDRAHEDVQAVGKVMSADFQDEQAFSDGRPGGDAYEAAKQALADHPDAIRLLTQASRCPDYDPQFNFRLAPSVFLETELLPNLARKRACIRALNYQALVDLGAGNRSEALAHSLGILRLARLYERDPLLVNHLVVIAARTIALQAANPALQAGPLPAQDYAALETELAAIDPAKSWRHVMETERAHGIDSFTELGESAGYTRLPMGKNDESDYLSLFATVIADGPRATLSDAAEKVLANAGPLTNLLGPALRAANEANARSLAEVRALRVVNALLRTGQTSDTPNLQALELPEDVFLDPFNLKPLVIKRAPNGWLVYAVGKDGKDDGGKLERFDDVGWGPK